MREPMTMDLPWLETGPLDATVLEALRRDVILRGAKWDPQIGDTSTVGRSPIILRRSAYEELVRLATSLAAELRRLEHAVMRDATAMRALGLSRSQIRWLRAAAAHPAIRLERFDFHFTDDGWRISEVNADVPGGLHEGVVGPLYARHHPGTVVPGDPAAAIARAFAAHCRHGAHVALVHATAYADDRQVISLLERSLASVGLVGVPCAPDQLRFGPARVLRGTRAVPIEGIYRFFPAEWLPNLPRDADLRGFASPGVVACNPVTALAVQSKRLPLIWDRFGLALPAFRRLLPETRAVREAPLALGPDWLIKPAFGRVGGGIVARGVGPTVQLARALLRARSRPNHYLAQRRFRTVPWWGEGDARTVCIGIFTLDGAVVGAYGRSTTRPIVDRFAVDTPVLVESTGTPTS